MAFPGINQTIYPTAYSRGETRRAGSAWASTHPRTSPDFFSSYTSSQRGPNRYSSSPISATYLRPNLSHTSTYDTSSHHSFFEPDNDFNHYNGTYVTRHQSESSIKWLFLCVIAFTVIVVLMI